jgi:WD40 repeat protein
MSASWSPNGQYLASASLDRTVRLWSSNSPGFSVPVLSRCPSPTIQQIDAHDNEVGSEECRTLDELGIESEVMKRSDRNKVAENRFPGCSVSWVMTLEGHAVWVTEVRYS